MMFYISNIPCQASLIWNSLRLTPAATRQGMSAAQGTWSNAATARGRRATAAQKTEAGPQVEMLLDYKWRSTLGKKPMLRRATRRGLSGGRLQRAERNATAQKRTPLAWGWRPMPSRRSHRRAETQKKRPQDSKPTIISAITRAWCRRIRPCCRGSLLSAAAQCGEPEYLRSENGPEFASIPLKEWLLRGRDIAHSDLSGLTMGEWLQQMLQWHLAPEVLNAEWIVTTR